MNKFDIVESDFNPTIFFACKSRMTRGSEYHSHDFAEITYILSGKGTYMVADEIYQVQSGDIIICNPGVKHQKLETNVQEPTIEFFTGFTDFQFRDMAPNSIELKNGGYLLRTSVETKQEISKHCYAMLAEQESCKIGKYFMLKAHLMQIILLILREMEPKRDQQIGCRFDSYNHNYAVKKIISYLNENYNEKISLEQLARNMYLSPVYISKIFKEETGESPINYLIQIRLEKAKEILELGDERSIKQIANSVGYDDVYHFSKLFKKYYGVSPLYYKKSVDKREA